MSDSVHIDTAALGWRKTVFLFEKDKERHECKTKTERKWGEKYVFSISPFNPCCNILNIYI